MWHVSQKKAQDGYSPVHHTVQWQVEPQVCSTTQWMFPITQANNASHLCVWKSTKCMFFAPNSSLRFVLKDSRESLQTHLFILTSVPAFLLHPRICHIVVPLFGFILPSTSALKISPQCGQGIGTQNVSPDSSGSLYVFRFRGRNAVHKKGPLLTIWIS